MTLLTSTLRPKYGPDLEIGTVDGMQGREKEVIIISLVRSNNTVSLSLFAEDISIVELVSFCRGKLDF